MPYPVQVGCTCPAGAQYAGRTWQQIHHAKRIAWLFSQPTWGDFKDADLHRAEPAAWAAAVSRPLHEGKGVYLYGPVGVGKTWLGVAAMRWLDAAGWAISLEHVPSWIEAIKEAIGQQQRKNDERDSGWQRPEAISRGTAQAEAILLDDLGSERLTAWSASELLRLVDERWRAKSQRITVITSNKSLDELLERFEKDREIADQGLRIVSRIRGMCVPIQLDGDDRRAEG